MDSERIKPYRNVAIILLLAVGVWKLPGGGTAAATLRNLFSILFMGGLFFLGFRLYKEHRIELFSLEERQRAVLYGSMALAVFAIVATSRMWPGLGAILWLAMLGAAGYGMYTVWRAYRTY